MAHPARKFDEKVPGNEDSAPPGSADLKALEGGGETSQPDRSWYKSQNGKTGPSSEDLAKMETTAGSSQDSEAQHENRLGSGYSPSPAKSSSKSPARRSLLSFNRKRALFGGGVIGTIIAIVIFFFSTGPLEFVHIAQLLQQFHFSSQQDLSDDRLGKLARYIRFRDTPERTRLGTFQNKIADRIESRMNNVGIESSYTNKFGFRDGYILDTEKLSKSQFEDLNGKSQAEIEKYFKETFNVDVHANVGGKNLPKGTVFIDANSAKMGYFQNRKLIKTMLFSAGYSKKASVVGARIMGKRAAVTWHPIERLKNSKLSDAERLKVFNREQVKYVQEGETANYSTKTNPDDKTGASQRDANSAQTALSEGDQANTDLSNGDSQAIDKLKSSLTTKLGAGSLTATGVLCIFYGLDKQSGEIKEAQVVLPLVRQGMQAISLGNQVMSGRDLDTTHLGDFKEFLNGKSANGKKTSWIQAESIQAELGHDNVGVKPDQTLTTINKDSPFHFLADGVIGTALSGACSAVGTGIQIVLGFFGGGIETQILQLAVGQIVGGPLINTAAQWLAGAAVNPLATGADFGNQINFGARLAANDQAVSEGGRKLSSAESSNITAFENKQWNEEFQSHNIAYKLFNPYDQRSAISQVIDRQSPDLNKNVTNLATGLFNFTHILASLPKLFIPHASAAVGNYNYGFPQYGFSVDEMNDSRVKNPYQNAEDVVKHILPAHPGYTDRAEKCFGVSIDDATYDVTSLGTDPLDVNKPNPEQQNFFTNEDPNHCADTNSDWMKVRFYIFDSQTITSAACYLGDEGDASTTQACSDVGFDNAQSGGTQSGNTSQSGPSPSGSVQSLAQQILANKNVVYPLDASSPNGSTKSVLQALAKGDPAPVTCPSVGGSTDVNPGILKMILDLAAQGKVGVNAITDKCHSVGSNHYKGKAVDFECQSVPFNVSKGDAIASKYGGERNGETCSGNQHWHYDFL